MSELSASHNDPHKAQVLHLETAQVQAERQTPTGARMSLPAELPRPVLIYDNK